MYNHNKIYFNNRIPKKEVEKYKRISTKKKPDDKIEKLLKKYSKQDNMVSLIMLLMKAKDKREKATKIATYPRMRRIKVYNSLETKQQVNRQRKDIANTYIEQKVDKYMEAAIQKAQLGDERGAREDLDKANDEAGKIRLGGDVPVTKQDEVLAEALREKVKEKKKGLTKAQRNAQDASLQGNIGAFFPKVRTRKIAVPPDNQPAPETP